MTHDKRIWIDLDNTPHVPFFRPIVRELEARGFEVAVSAREAFQVCELADVLAVRYVKIGRHYGKHPVLKVWGLARRALQLLPFALAHRPRIALSHGSRSQILVAKLLRIPTVMVMDYEHARTPWVLRPRWEIVPHALRDEALQCRSAERVMTYPGIKEDVYAPEFEPDDALAATLGLDRRRVVVTVRPPATEAHYHSTDSDDLFVRFMDIACADRDVQVILLPRNKAQEARLRTEFPRWFEGRSVVVPAVAVDGLNLLWQSDLVVSGGGTMNREAAALGIPVYSIFRGPIGAVDRQLQRDGRLVLIDSVDRLEEIVFRRRDRTTPPKAGMRGALASILAHVESVYSQEYDAAARAALRRVS